MTKSGSQWRWSGVSFVAFLLLVISPVGHGEQVVGDMPHNWASAEFIRLVRHSLMLERGGELHLFESVPR